MRHFLLFALTLVSASLQGQELRMAKSDKIWLSQRFIDTLNSTKDISMHSDQRKPLEAILDHNGNIYLKPYGSKFVLAQYKTIEKGRKIELINFPVTFNLNSLSIEKYKDCRFFLTYFDDECLFETTKGNKKIDSMIFISSYHGYKLEEPRVAYHQILLEGTYTVKNNLGLSQKLQLNFDGSISGQGIVWDSYHLERVNVGSSNGETYHLVKFQSAAKNSSKPLALGYDSLKKTWIGYRYKRVKANEIEVDSQNPFELKRIP